MSRTFDNNDERLDHDDLLANIEQYFNERGFIVHHDRWLGLIASVFADWSRYLEDGS